MRGRRAAGRERAGSVLGITAESRLTLSHEPIPELGQPAMQVDLPVQGVDLGAVPIDAPATFDLTKGDDGLSTVVAVRPHGTVAEP